MGLNKSDFPKQLAEARPSTRHLINSVLLDQWPSKGVAIEFGIETQEQYEAIHYLVRNQEVTPKQLDAAHGGGLKMESLVHAAPCGLYKEMGFRSALEIIMDRINDPPEKRIEGKERDGREM